MKLFIGVEFVNEDSEEYYAGSVIETDEKVMDIFYNYFNHKDTIKYETINLYDEHNQKQFKSTLKEIKYSLILKNDGIFFSNSGNGMSCRIANLIEVSVFHDIDIDKELMNIINMELPKRKIKDKSED